MGIKRTYKYRIESNKDVLATADNWIELCRKLYNACLEQRIIAYKQNKKSIHCYQQMNELPELKIAMPEYKMVGSQVLQNVVERLDKTFYRFLARVGENRYKAGFPRYKSNKRYNSITFKNCGWKLDGKYLDIYNLGRFKIRLSRPILGDIKTITLKKHNTGKWFANFSCDNVPIKEIDSSKLEVGIDVGVKSFVVDSNGEKIENPRYLKNTHNVIRYRHNSMNRKKKGSLRRNKSKVLLSKAHDKIRSQRDDFIHKLSTDYIRKYGVIYVEDLYIENMMKNRRLAEAISDSPWGKFIRYLLYKAEDAGREVIKVPAKNTSQICSRCGEKVIKKLQQRQHKCPYCGLVLDRDENAARNILAVGQTVQELTYAVAQCVS